MNNFIKCNFSLSLFTDILERSQKEEILLIAQGGFWILQPHVPSGPSGQPSSAQVIPNSFTADLSQTIQQQTYLYTSIYQAYHMPHN